MLKIILFFVIAAVIEVIQMTVLNNPHSNEKADPDAVVVTAYRGDSNFNQWERYIGDFAGRPDFIPEINITVNRNTGTYYIPKYVRERKRNDLLSLIISVAVSWLIVNMIF